MIMRPNGAGLLAISQPDHAQMAGVLAEAWGSRVPEALVVASHHHDDGWWEQSPTVDQHGRPFDFLTLPILERVAIYRQGVSGLCEIDLAAALLTSLHFSRLVAAGLESLHGEDRRVGETFIAAQVAWEIQARAALGEPRGVEAAYQVLRAVDYLSLVLCMHPVSELGGLCLPPVRFAGQSSACNVRLEVPDPSSETIHVDPYPFGPAPLSVGVNARSLKKARFPSGEAYRTALAAAPVQPLRFCLLPASPR
jgi:hypothetical protein